MKVILAFIVCLYTMAMAGQIKIGDNPASIDPSSAMEVESTSQGFLPPRMTAVQRQAIANPAPGLVVYNYTTNCIDFYTGSYWFEICGTDTSDVAASAVFGTANSTLAFMQHNLGADYDAPPLVPGAALNGNYYKWGNITPAATGTTTEAAIAGWQDIPHGAVGSWNAGTATAPVKVIANDPCPEGFRVPTNAEWAAVFTPGNGNTITYVGTWTNSAANFSSGLCISTFNVVRLYLPTAGFRFAADGGLDRRGSHGNYWSSTESGGSSYGFIFTSSSTSTSVGLNRNRGLSIRCIRQ